MIKLVTNRDKMMKLLRNTLLVLVVVLIVTGCETVQTVHETAHDRRVAIHAHRVAYCSKTADSAAKKVAIMAIRAEVPLYPTEGICIGIEEE